MWATLFTEIIAAWAALHHQDLFPLVFWKSVTFRACLYVSRQQARGKNSARQRQLCGSSSLHTKSDCLLQAVKIITIIKTVCSQKHFPTSDIFFQINIRVAYIFISSLALSVCAKIKPGARSLLCARLIANVLVSFLVL